MTEEDRLIELAIAKLELRNDIKTKTRLKEIFSENSLQSQKFTNAVKKVCDVGKFDRGDAVGLLRGFYESSLTTMSSENCDFCRKSGWLKVILISGMHNNYAKTWIYDCNQPTKYDKYLRANHTFSAEVTKMPCKCESGNNRNIKNGVEWIPVSRRGEILQKSFKWTKGDFETCDATEDYYIKSAADRINNFKLGIDEHVRKLSTYPDIQTLQKELTAKLEVMK